ncbi:MAG: hypothetical protein LBR41_00355, partial [Rickettsiales bacterium]|nr:hypothetical protein [Rickettsiales bacterium]
IIRGRGATWDGIGAAVADLVKCIAGDARRVVTVSALTAGFIKSPVAFSLPRTVGRDGIIQTLIPPVDKIESRALKFSATTILQNYKNNH